MQSARKNSFAVHLEIQERKNVKGKKEYEKKVLCNNYDVMDVTKTLRPLHTMVFCNI